MAKGSNFEREVSKDLSLWLTQGEMQDAVWRTSSSGARATQRKKNKENKIKKYDYGDLRPDHDSVNYFFDVFSCELKTGYQKKSTWTNTKWSFNDLIDSVRKTTVFELFWEQCSSDAESSKREPILIFRRNNSHKCIAMNQDIYYTFTKFNKDKELTYIKLNLCEFKYPIIVCNFTSFLNQTMNIICPKFINLSIKKIIMKRITNGKG